MSIGTRRMVETHTAAADRVHFMAYQLSGYLKVQRQESSMRHTALIRWAGAGSGGASSNGQNVSGTRLCLELIGVKIFGAS